MAITSFTALKSEITTDPASYGYAQFYNAGDDVDTANLLNTVFQATLSAGLSTGAAITSVPVQALPFALPAGATLILLSGSHSQQITVAAPGAAAQATSVPVTSFTPNFAYPTTSLIMREQITVQYVSTDLINAAVVESEFAALTGNLPTLWGIMMEVSGGKQNISVQGFRNQVGAIWGSGTQTLQNLVQLQFRAGSRAEKLFGIGTNISATDVGTARQS